MFIVLATTPSRTAQAFGTPTGKPLATETAAQRRKRDLERQYPHAHFLVLPISVTA